MGFFLSAEERARRRQDKKAIREKAKTLIATTADIRTDYTIIDIIRAESLLALKEKAVKMRADALIGIGFFGYDEQCYGTVVKYTVCSEIEEVVEQVSEKETEIETPVSEPSDHPTTEPTVE
ncbi:hypothetical protein ACFL27_02270 [candidate division CSSED10-310 bacterium]|uniref:Uncharacterized protein n=1 Tax=candidate division CSSED10-310 bacterium TaxID=2855610 RepID=A0ABV6YS40_UNCC1